MASKRELIDTGTDKRYVRRNEKGQFAEVSPKKRVLRAPEPSNASSFKVTLTAQRAARLNELARKAGITPEELLQTSVEGWLSSEEGFDQVAAYVLKKNAELYRRLA
jgi:antitoxin FitA